MPAKKINKTVKTKKPAPKAAAVRKRKREVPAQSKPAVLHGKYVEAVGRRKTAVARVRLFTKGDKGIVVNERELKTYFPAQGHRNEVTAPLERLNITDKFWIVVQARGSGVHAQAQAIRHGLARALVKFNPDFRKRLKRAGFLTRDARMVERKKPGLKKARRAPQWQKR